MNSRFTFNQVGALSSSSFVEINVPLNCVYLKSFPDNMQSRKLQSLNLDPVKSHLLNCAFRKYAPLKVQYINLHDSKTTSFALMFAKSNPVKSTPITCFGNEPPSHFVRVDVLSRSMSAAHVSGVYGSESASEAPRSGRVWLSFSVERFGPVASSM